MAAVEGNGEPVVEEQGLQFRIKETLITPAGVNVVKESNPVEGEVVTLKFLVGLPIGPGAIAATELIGFRLSEVQARELASAMTSGVIVARPGEVPNLKS